jgi:Arc/MetJ-type ribon-helix-helix transcriptional regulator
MQVPRIDVRDLTEEQLVKLDQQVEKLGLKSRSDYIRLIIELDAATGIIEKLKK